MLPVETNLHSTSVHVQEQVECAAPINHNHRRPDTGKMLTL